MTLDEDEAALLQSARGAFSPEPEVAERVKAAVLAGVLGASLGGAGHTTDVARPGVSSSWGFGQGFGSVVVKVLLGAVVALGLSAGAATLAFRGDTTHAPPPRATVVTMVATAPPKPASSVHLEVDRESPERARHAPAQGIVSGARSPAPRSPGGLPLAPRRKESPASLAAELAAVRAAEAAVNGGNPIEALAILDASATSKPNLREEREALRTLAECARAFAPRAELGARFVTAFPGSLYGARVREACASSAGRR